MVQSGAIAAYNAGATGAGVVAAVIDSGIAVNSVEFSGRIHAASADLAGSRGLQDEGGHGTAVSSVLLGAKNDSATHGVAFGAQLLVARTDTVGSCANTAPDQGCSHNDNAIARGVDLAVANRARVINLSLGGSPANSTLRSAIGRATAAGVILVISAGNEGVTDPAAAVNPDLFAQIANDPLARNLVIIAGALDASNAALAGFSNRAGNSATHYLGALGRRVAVIDETGTQDVFSGTSFAAPVISGAVALLAQAFPTLSSVQIVDLLFRSAIDIGTAGVDDITGRGALDIARAFAPQGQLALAGSATPVSLGSISTTSTPIGDAAQTGFSAVVLDQYGRAYTAELGGTIHRAPQQRRLEQGLGTGTRNIGFDRGGIGVSLSIAEQQLSLTQAQSLQARAVAGEVIARIGARTQVALGISRGGLALARERRGQPQSAFLVGRSASNDWGFDNHAQSGLALSHRVAGFDLSLAAENGRTQMPFQQRNVAQPLDRSRYDAAAFGVSRTVGPLTLASRATMLVERGALLGAQFDTLYGVNRTTSLFADFDAQMSPLQNWALRGSLRRGWSRVSSGGVRRESDRLTTSAWSFDVTRAALFSPADSFALRISQPLRVTRGGLDLTLPSGYDYFSGETRYSGQRLNLTPNGRERNIEAVYTRPLLGGSISANLFWRSEPGNIAAAPDDQGAAIRLAFGL